VTIEADPATLAVHFGQTLASAGVPYAIGGAIAYGFWGVPRGTRDLDINLFVPASAGRAAIDALVEAGLTINPAQALRSGAERGDARGTYENVPVDLFFVSIPLHESAARRTSEVPLLDATIRILSAEDLTLFKLLFFRGKDIVDVERLVAVQGKRLDRGYVLRWLIDCVGEHDVRVERWNAICSALPAD